ncbi:hypothetical protein GGS21DRAFT_486155 [Xylaria nigripes]|nr:hypothetical protein GGS21DRAFT_486155 [Xylaria nigripes]
MFVTICLVSQETGGKRKAGCFTASQANESCLKPDSDSNDYNPGNVCPSSDQNLIILTDAGQCFDPWRVIHGRNTQTRDGRLDPSPVKMMVTALLLLAVSAIVLSANPNVVTATTTAIDIVEKTNPTPAGPNKSAVGRASLKYTVECLDNRRQYCVKYQDTYCNHGGFLFTDDVDWCGAAHCWCRAYYVRPSIPDLHS